MPSHCANLAVHAARLREAQRAFFLAWKAVQGGDRSKLAEARRARRELEGVHRDIERTLYAAWTPKALEHVERKKNLRHVRTLHGRDQETLVVGIQREHGHDIIVTYVRNSIGSALESFLVRRSIHPALSERSDELFGCHGRIHRAILCPDGNVVAVIEGKVEFIDVHSFPAERRELSHTSTFDSALHVHYDGRIFAGDVEGKIHIWTPRDDGSYSETLVSTSRHAVKELHVFVDGSFALIDQNNKLAFWKQHESDDGTRNDWAMKFQHFGDFPGYYTAMHASLDGRLAVGDTFCNIEVYDQDREGSLHFVRSLHTIGKLLALQVLPDHRIVGACADGTVNVWEPDDNDRHRFVEHTDQLYDDARIETANIAVNEQGLIAVVFNETDIHVLDGNPHVSPK